MLSDRTTALESLEPRSLFSAAPGPEAFDTQLTGSPTVVTASAADAGETIATAAFAGRFDGPRVRTFAQDVGATLGDNVDYYKFRVTKTMHVTITLTGMAADLDLNLEKIDGTFVGNSITSGTTAESVTRVLTPGWYAVKVAPFFLDESPYVLKVRTADLPADAGNTLATATPLAAFNTPKKVEVAQITGGAGDTGDYYKFRVNQTMRFNVRLRNLTDNLDLGIYRSNNTLITSSTNDDNDSEYAQRILTPGWYYIRVDPYDDAHSAYSLQVDATAASAPTAAMTNSMGARAALSTTTAVDPNAAESADADQGESVLDMVLPELITLG